MALSRYSYLTADLIGDGNVEELPLAVDGADRTVNGYGECRATLDLRENALAGVDVRAATEPARRVLYVLRDGQVVWGGIIWRRTRNQRDHRLQLQAYEFASYFARRLISRDFVVPPTTDEFRAARLLFSQAQDQPGGNIGIMLDGGDSGFPAAERLFPGHELTPVLEALDRLAQDEGGFDWRIDVTGDTVRRKRTLRLGRPTLGRYAADSDLVWESPGSVVDWTDDDDAWTSSTTERWEVGATPDATDTVPDPEPLRVSVTDSAAIAAGAPLLQTSGSERNAEASRSHLTSWAVFQIQQNPVPITTYEVTVRGDVQPEFGSYQPGDEGLFIVTDDWHRPGEGREDGLRVPLRIGAMTINPQTDIVGLTVGPITRRRIVQRQFRFAERLRYLERVAAREAARR